MKERMHFVCLQTLLIAFGELVFVAVIGIVARAEASSMESGVFPWYLPFSLVLIAVLTALPGLLLFDLESSCRWKLRIVLHFLFLGVVVMTAGHFFNWYNDVRGAVLIFFVFCAIYAFVWAAVYMSYKRDDDKINKKLAQKSGESSAAADRNANEKRRHS